MNELQFLAQYYNWLRQNGRMAPMGFTTLPQNLEQQFKQWYAQQYPHLNPDPDAPKQHYDYRMAFLSGQGLDPQTQHGSSKFKMAGHPNRFVPLSGGITLDSSQMLPLGDIRYREP